MEDSLENIEKKVAAVYRGRCNYNKVYYCLFHDVRDVSTAYC